MLKSDITVIILTRNEAVHIERCVSSLLPVVSRIVVVDSFSTDNTCELAVKLGAEVFQRAWLNYSDQFQWALDNCNIRTAWVMRMDADEYLEYDLQARIASELPRLDADIGGIYLNRKHVFYGKWIRFGGRYPLPLLRIWRNGSGRIEDRWMDEHVVIDRGLKTSLFKGGLVDANLKGVHFFVEKCNEYATREAIDVLGEKYGFSQSRFAIEKSGFSRVKITRFFKSNFYNRLPLGARALVYFIYRYFFRLGFLDGWYGFVYHFMQGFWYRLLVDVKLYEVEMYARGDRARIAEFFFTKYGKRL